LSFYDTLLASAMHAENVVCCRTPQSLKVRRQTLKEGSGASE